MVTCCGGHLGRAYSCFKQWRSQKFFTGVRYSGCLECSTYAIHCSVESGTLTGERIIIYHTSSMET